MTHSIRTLGSATVSCATIIAALCDLSPGLFAEDDLRVLPVETDAGPTSAMLSRHVRRLADEAFERRRKEYESVKTAEDAVARQSRLRKHFLEHLGGLPERTPLDARTVGTIDGDGYRVEKVMYESQPAHHVTAVLFLPKSPPPYPGVVIPCGHSSTGKAAQQRMCILLAKNGIAALSYDPIGQGERSQILDDDGKQKYRATSEHNVIGQSSVPLGRNTATFRIWDGMRSIDYLAGRSEVDEDRIGVTGCSGGGTLTSYLMALDERVACAAPSCYITSFQRLLDTIGPQDAEQNIHGQLAFGMDHADYLMMRAPRPTLVLASTHDFFDIDGTWDSFRQAKRFYTRLGYAERVSLVETDAKHGYPKLQREAMVRWMRRFLLGIDEPVTEPDFETHSTGELQCTPDGQVMLMDGERSVLDLNVDFSNRLSGQRRTKWKVGSERQTLDEVRRLAGIRKLEDLPLCKVVEHGFVQREGYRIGKCSIQPEPGIHLPMLLFAPPQPSGRRVLYLHGDGKGADAEPGGRIEQLVRRGDQVLAVDLRGMGETKTTGRDVMISYLLGQSLVGIRAQDVLTASLTFRNRKLSDPSDRIHIIAEGRAIPPAVHAAALEPELFASLEMKGDVPSWADVVRLPTTGRMSETVHGALTVYDLPDLVRSFERTHTPASAR